MIKKHLLFYSVVILTTSASFAQLSSLTIEVLDHEGQAIIGALVELKKMKQKAITDIDGKAQFNNLKDSTYSIIIESMGYEKMEQKVVVAGNTTIPINVEEHDQELEEVVVSITRSGRTISNTASRVEVIDGEELGEKAMMNSSNIAVLLKESTGIQVQQTSAASGNKSIRIQGLDGRYTQMVKDGFPLYSGFSSGLSIMQIPPLDLAQVEVIKGSASTLYGGGAIAGVVNLVSKRPHDEQVLELMIDQTSALRTSLNVFASNKKDKIGYTIYGAGNIQAAYDVNNDDFSDIPESKTFSLTPTLFIDFNDNTDLRASITGTIDDRIGGDMQVIRGDIDSLHTFSESNNSNRASSQLTLTSWLSDTRRFIAKNSISYFDRNLKVNDMPTLTGKQWATFTELSVDQVNASSDWIIGLNAYTDAFDESSALQRNYANNTLGAFGQVNKDFADSWVLEAGLRTDITNNYGGFVLPRLSLLKKIKESSAIRIGGGFGYKVPSMFTESAESMAFQNIIVSNLDSLTAEKSQGINIDYNFKKELTEEWSVSFNQLFFYTHLNDPLVLTQTNTNEFKFRNTTGAINTFGFESNLKLQFKDFKLFANYAQINTLLNYGGIDKQQPLTPRHNLGAVIMYEVHEKWRVGYELYFTGKQNRSDFTRTKAYTEMGFMVMRSWEHFGIYINFENFTDTRLSKFESSSTGSHTTPQFAEIWAPSEGIVINGGIKLSL